jgi:hypothetical protein
MRFAMILVLAEIITPRSPSPDIVDSSHVREDVEAGRKAQAAFQARVAREDHDRQLRFDRVHMREHKQMLALFRKARARYDRARTERAIDGARTATRGGATSIRHTMEEMDRWRNSSKVFGDYDALLESIENAYPAALEASLRGDRQPLTAVRASFDAHMNGVRRWLAQAAKHVDEPD